MNLDSIFVFYIVQPYEKETWWKLGKVNDYEGLRWDPREMDYNVDHGNEAKSLCIHHPGFANEKSTGGNQKWS